MRCKCRKCRRSRNNNNLESSSRNNNNLESSSRNNNNRCQGCVCDQLRRLNRGTEVDVFLSGGQILEDVIFLRFDRNNCCAFFRDEETEPGSTLIVDCQKIDAIRIEAD